MHHRPPLEPGRAAADPLRGFNEANSVDAVFGCGPLMRNLWNALSSGRRGGYAGSAAELESLVIAAIRGGDVIMVKGPLGSCMKAIVNALARRFPHKAACGDAAM
jgi:UDP-N-acetylmuramoyl-tripeptide--D-alanyl-D-alanine ligase